MKLVHVDPADLEVGMTVTLWRNPDGHSGQGGTITHATPCGFTLACGNSGDFKTFFDREDIHHATVDAYYDADECLDYGPDCSGRVDDWWSGGTTGRTWPRCDYHGQARLNRYENSSERWADSDCPPDWYDPAYAGERWDDE